MKLKNERSVLGIIDVQRSFYGYVQLSALTENLKN